MADPQTVIASLQAAGIGEKIYIFIRNATEDEDARKYAQEWQVQVDIFIITIKEIRQIEREYDIPHLLDHLWQSDKNLLRREIHRIVQQAEAYTRLSNPPS